MAGHGKSKRHPPGESPGDSPSVTKPPLEPGLYLVATPIGNAADITLRALDVLARADVLACEDTRRTRQLMTIHGIGVGDRPVISYNDRNGAARRPQIVSWLQQGMSVAYASDAGTPLVSDPGFRLVEAAHEGGHGVHAVPGPSAVLAALTVAGLPSDRFLFLGFLAPRQAARRRALEEIADLRATLIAFEAPHRAGATLSDLADILRADRRGAIVRGLTRKPAEARRGRRGERVAELQETRPVRGEVGLLAGPPSAEGAATAEDLDAALAEAMEMQSLKEAVSTVARRLGLPRREVYARALEISGRRGSGRAILGKESEPPRRWCG